MPMVLGHEGAGVIEAVGDGVDPSRLGEEVVLTFSPACNPAATATRAAPISAPARRTRSTTASCATGRRASTTAAETSSTSRSSPRSRRTPSARTNAAIAIPPGLPPRHACLLGCGVTTGVLSVVQRAGVRPGESVAVFACGGVGLSAIQGARLVTALPIIAVDPVPAKRDLALALGATHAVDPAAGDVVEQVRAIVPDGVDHVFEALGSPEVGAQAFACVRDGGTTTLIGQPAMGVRPSFPTYDVTQFEHTILGSNLGGGRPPLDIPRLARLAQAERLDIASLVTHVFTLEQINEAIETTASGQAGRVVIDLDDKESP